MAYMTKLDEKSTLGTARGNALFGQPLMTSDRVK